MWRIYYLLTIFFTAFISFYKVDTNIIISPNGFIIVVDTKLTGLLNIFKYNYSIKKSAYATFSSPELFELKTSKVSQRALRSRMLNALVFKKVLTLYWTKNVRRLWWKIRLMNLCLRKLTKKYSLELLLP